MPDDCPMTFEPAVMSKLLYFTDRRICNQLNAFAYGDEELPMLSKKWTAVKDCFHSS